MPRKEVTQDQASIGTPAEQSAAMDAIDEIDSAVAVAEASLTRTDKDFLATEPVTGAAPAEVAMPVATDSAASADAGDVTVATDDRRTERNETREERMNRMIKRAKDQKERGRFELQKPYDGAMSVLKQLKYFDVNIASSAERFIGVIDLALYTMVRRGPLAIGVDASDEILERFNQMVNEYVDNAQEAKQSALAVLNNEKDSTLGDWLSPEYTSTAFECNLQAKHRLTTRLVDALTAWDSAIHDLNVLEWNGKVDAAQVSQTREQERRGLSAIYGFSIKTLQGLKRRTEKAPSKKSSAAPVAANEELAAA
ncbi:hypothetical protein LP417_35190 (plasmid) [Polaromonas sp. P1-6]|nr:hypothetical protein LP417_35190 [Polaromonas sp. P1-6]